MFLLITLLSIAGFFVTGYFHIKTEKKDKELSEDWLNLSCFCLIVLILFIVIDCTLGIKILARNYTIEREIALYQQENENIEKSIDSAIKVYMNHEQEVFKELKNEELVFAASAFPELKSDILVQQQIEVYISNNNKIKELKLAKINIEKYKFLLYFGGEKNNEP